MLAASSLELVESQFVRLFLEVGWQVEDGEEGLVRGELERVR